MAAEFDTSHVKNIVLLGHAGSGKTTLAECMLFEAGLINRRGSVEEATSVGDYHPLEQERGNSIFSKLMHTKWRGYKINILDTPGYDDFVGEVLSALRVADTGVMVLNATMGVEVGTDIIWEYTDKFKTPMIFAVNKLDDDSADFDRTVQEAKDHFGSKVTVVQYPRQQGAGFHEIIDVLRMTMYKFHDTGGKPEKLAIPDEEKEKAEALHKELVEAIASNDEALMEKYFDKGELEEDEMKEGLKKAMIAHDIFPLFCLSALRNMGSGRLMGFIDNVCPSANEMPPQKTIKGEEVPCDAAGPPCLFVYKTISEPHVGDLSFFKVFSGTVKTGMELVNESNGVIEKINQLFLLEGAKRLPVQELVAGDIGATLKLRNTHVNNTLHAKGKMMELPPIEFPTANVTVCIESVNKGEEEKMAQALHQLREEDPTLIIEMSKELKQTLVHCQGDMHLAVAKWKIENGQKVPVKFGKPKIAYRETIRKPAEANYRHKKQSGGAGQFGEVFMRIEPYYEGMPDPSGLTVRGRETFDLEWGGKLVFYNCIVGGAIDARFLPSILKGVMEKMNEGPLTGSYVRDVRVCVYDGKMHAVDSNDISFKIAGIMAFKDAFQKADPQVLEPIYQVEVLCPEELTGAVMGDLQSRRGMVEGIDAEGHFQKVLAKVPLAEMHGFSSSLRSITQGRAKFKMRFESYQPMGYELQKKLTEEYNKSAEEAIA
ncbi:elongation factor G [Flavisolibacter ginsenosidimutans]|uniref:Elongation factor G n=1 Tax=Flavisolibacter ginsenosidimutans TaxID=661481 RepID=A0A5B8UF40_9BACT|nr:elongation factor G [Flavisolibacter ginsenosidimutans]QEC54985.1 elongation factor G [Flavisolibacter ginsenosidimutans]